MGFLTLAMVLVLALSPWIALAICLVSTTEP